MAQRRMFSLQVVETDRFLDLPVSAQCLYFHLGMHGDDDGFVSSPNGITRGCGCTGEDLELLSAAGLIHRLDSGICLITDWRLNNTLKNDRYQPTRYAAEMAQLQAQYPHWFRSGSKTDPQQNKTKQNGGKKKRAADDCAQQDFDVFWQAYPKKRDKQRARSCFLKAAVHTDLQTMLEALEQQKTSLQWTAEEGRFIPYPATWLRGRRWEDEPEASPAPDVYTPRPDILPQYGPEVCT